MADDKPIIVVKKKGGHGGHHGGAWKIAYADFVTAMMAFFMVMWLVNSASSPTKQAIASYFRKPGLFEHGSGTPLLIGQAGILEEAFVPARPEDKRNNKKDKNQNPKPRTSGETNRDLDKRYIQEGNEEPVKSKGSDTQLGLNSELEEAREIKNEDNITRPDELKEEIEKAAAQIQAAIESDSTITAALGQLEIKVDADGLKIEIMDTDGSSMFDSGSARIKPTAEAAFQRVTSLIKQFPNELEITGHTDAKPFPSRSGGYTNWELSSDRANAARRLIETQGFPTQRITSVTGKAATEPKLPDQPTAPKNRRISINMKFKEKDDSELSQEATNKALDELLGPRPTVDPTTVRPIPTPTPTPTPTATPTRIPDARVASTPKPTPPPPKDRIRLPDGPVVSANPDYMPEDKIFNNSPVIGAAELFSR